MKWISGRELHGRFQGDISKIIEPVRQGVITPYLLAEPMTWSDPDEHQGAHRLLPTRSDRSKYDTLQWLRFRRAKLREWLNQSDDEIRAADEWMERIPIRDPVQRRARKQKELADVNRDIEKFENELEPAKIWRILKQSDLSPAKEEQLKALLLESYYLTEEVEKIDRDKKPPQKARKRDAKAAANEEVREFAKKKYQEGFKMEIIVDLPEIRKIYKKHQVEIPSLSYLRKLIQGPGKPGRPRKE
ncbi:hypothetical protein [Desulforhabdus amnigena]|uniref:Uncharacterized protein n=1 Tax=Desulforhabdus amnigena TaxID=40218 RepID=A0A9W6FWM3_9BACT|nr:hypothetical protein [Desulforhabdus amnigena]GLI36173.1 hypothetical protein DAMNIGENAA_36060 [Desulforhabdus amnigena]